MVFTQVYSACSLAVNLKDFTQSKHEGLEVAVTFMILSQISNVRHYQELPSVYYVGLPVKHQ